MSTESEVDEKELEQLCFNIANCGSCESGGQCSYHNDEIRNLITRREQEAEAALILKFEGALADHATEVRIGNDLAWRQVVYWDDVESVLAALTHPTSADSLNLSKSKGLKPAKDFDPSQVTLCPSCNQVTHTIMSDTKGNEDYCGKCGKVKPADIQPSELGTGLKPGGEV